MIDRQLECFASARLLVGMEGAGLTNALAMPRGATVVNLHPAHPASGFSTLRSHCGQVRHVHTSRDSRTCHVGEPWHFAALGGREGPGRWLGLSLSPLTYIRPSRTPSHRREAPAAVTRR